MTIARITIKKQLADSRYAYNKTDLEVFSTEFLVRTNASFFDSQIKDYANALALVESRLYPSFILFKSARVQLATPGATADGFRAEFFEVDFEDLRGQFQVAPDDVLASSQVVGIYKRSASIGRSGELMIKHALTAREFSEYQLQDKVPPRFKGDGADTDRPAFHFGEQLIEVVRPSNGRLLMQLAAADEQEPLRTVEDFVFWEFRMRNAAPKRKTATQKKGEAARKARETAQKRLDELGRDAQRVKEVIESVTPTPALAPLLLPFQTQAREIYESLDSSGKVRIKWPDILRTSDS